MKKGKFIVIYGINNLGKSTHAKFLVAAIRKVGQKAEYIKYPIYKQEPTGKLINEYLRQDNPNKFSPREFQLLHFIDKVIYEQELKAKLNKGINIVAEDYFGTTLAWGIATGVDQKLLEYFGQFILKEDMAILLHGKRFKKAKEKKHKHENNEKLIKLAQKAHLKIGKKYGWYKVDTRLPLEEKNKIIWEKVRQCIFK